MKKLLTSLCVLALVLACIFVLPTTAQAAQEEGYTYVVTNEEATITGYTGAGGEITIPSILGGYPVTAIGEYAFFFCGDLTAVTIPDSVTAIGGEAFSGCDNLTSVTLGNGVVTIGDRAFFECVNLKTITLPDSVTTIGSFAFSGCGKLTAATIRGGAIGTYAFSGCKTLKTVTLGNGVTAIGSNAFANCDSLAAATIPDSVTTMDTQAFYNCDNLETVTIGDGVISIGTSAFQGCNNLMTVTVGNRVTTIGEKAFEDCGSLNTVSIPASVTTIGAYAFRYCRGLRAVFVDENNANYSSNEYGILFDKNQTILIQAPAKLSGDYTVPGSVTEILDFAFAGCTELTAAVLPDSVIAIGAEAFNGCFRLASVTIGSGVTAIGEKAFDGCDSMIAISVAKENAVYSSDDRGVLFNKDKTTLLKAPNGILGGYTVPDGVTSIGDSAFEDCYRLTGVLIGDKVTTLGERAFYFCDSMLFAVIPDSVTTIGADAFYACYSLQNTYYKGYKTQWKKIQIGNGNGLLTGCAISYNYTPVTAQVTTQPKNMAAENGQRLKVTVKATGDGLKYAWFYMRQGATQWTRAASVKNVLAITMGAKWDGCNVYCVITDRYGNTVTTDTMTLCMGATAEITTQPKNVVAEAGQRKKVTVKATGDGLQYAWYYMRKGATKYTKAASTKNVLVITMGTKWDGCKAYCVITDKHGNSVKTDVVTLYQGTPAKITTQPKNLTMAQGKRGKVTVKASGEGLTYTWYYLRKNNSKYTKAASTKNYLSLTMAAKWNGTKVYCKVTDKYGTTVKSDIVTLKMK